jgi:hypothetical protein
MKKRPAGKCFGRIRSRLTALQRIEALLHTLLQKVDHMRADLEKFRQDFDTETTRIADLQAAEIAELKALRDQVATAGDTAVAAALDEVIAGLQPIEDRLKVIGTDPAQPIPPVEPPA